MKLPSSTYRIQLHKEFNFNDLKKIIDYLHKLGVSTIYAAPILKSTPGSQHGYDVTDPHVIDPEIGTTEDLQELLQLLKERKMTWVQDIVPNHMAFSPFNYRLMDVFERGPRSPYYNYFDINWNHHNASLKGRVMVPFLGKELDQCIDDNELEVTFSKNGFEVKYFDSAYPLSIQSLPEVVGDKGTPLASRIAEYNDYAGYQRSLQSWKVFKQGWIESVHRDEHLIKQIEACMAAINSDKKALKSLLDKQHYILTFWKNTEKEINYRRFFTVNSLICLRMEDDEVFHEYHQFAYALFQNGLLHGLRIDHIDGLNDPSQYIKNLRNLFGEECYIIAEKILEAQEEMPEHWPLHGTSGYEFLSYVNQLFTNRKGAAQLVKFYEQIVPGIPDYNELVYKNKTLILERYMAGELENMVNYFFELNLGKGFDRSGIRQALSLIMLALPVYRIYPDKLPLKGVNLKLINETFEKAHASGSAVEKELNHFYALCTSYAQDHDLAPFIILFLKRLMQFTGPLTAKGVEDTTFYVYNPLISHDEVGDTPDTLGISIQTFHHKMIRRLQVTPHSLNATATHDTKRGEDARIRLNLICKNPQEWIDQVHNWMSINKTSKKTIGDGIEAPIINDEYFIYQSIIGGFPEDLGVTESWIERLQEYIVKVVREAKVMSNWETPDEQYENACKDFIASILKDNIFLSAILPYVRKLFADAAVYSISQAVMKMTSPGIPDVYQGCELYDLSYVDPDNRRPVNYEKRLTLLNQMQQLESEGNTDLLQFVNNQLTLGVGKLFATYKILNFRKQNAKLFADGSYLPLEVSQPGVAIAFARQYMHQWLIVIIPFYIGSPNTSEEQLGNYYISLPTNSPQEWKNILTGEKITAHKERIALSEALNMFPVAVLWNEESL